MGRRVWAGTGEGESREVLTSKFIFIFVLDREMSMGRYN